MFPGIDPKKMQQLMKQMGIQQQEIDASRVIIEKDDNTKIIIENPSIVKINMQGQKTYQISGEEREVSAEENETVKEEDTKLVMEKTGCSRKDAENALETTKGDIAESISLLMSK